jgi:hypothetical protein
VGVILALSGAESIANLTGVMKLDGAGPLRGRTAPWLGPFLACIFPIVLG